MTRSPATGRVVMMSGWSGAHRWYLAAGALTITGGPLLSPALHQAAYVGVGGSVIAAISYGVRRHRPPWVRPWRLLTACVAVSVLASVLWGLDLADDGVRRFPSFGDAAYLLMMPLLMLSIIGWTRQRQGRGGLVEAGIVAAGGATLIWALVMEPLLDSGQVHGLRLASYLLYLCFDLGVMVLVTRLVLISRIRTRAYALLITGAAVLIATDLIFYVLLVHDPTTTPLTAAGYLTSYVLLGGAALHPSMARSGGDVVIEPDPVSRLRLIGYVGLILVSGALNVMQFLGGARGETGWYDIVVPIALSSAMAVLLVVRLAQLAVLLSRRSRLDTLTGLANLTQLRDDIASFDPAAFDPAPFDPARESGAALLLVDLDGFRDINDSYGHHVGDEILRAVADRLRTLVAPYGTAPVRLSGDEFAILLRAESDRVARELVEVVSRPYRLADGGSALLTASIGMRPLPERATAGQALREADLALLTSQSNGGNQVAVYDSAQHAVRQARTQLVRDLHRATVAEEFTIEYQPIVSLTTETVVAAEALLRWTRSDGTRVPPDRFIPVAEQSGAIVPIGGLVIAQVCAQQREWYPRYGVPVTVNVSARQLRLADFADGVLAALRANDLPGSALIIEITETGLITAVTDAATVMAQLHALRRNGVQIAIDDFGTGYSSLAYLRQLPVDILKMDGSFTANQVQAGSARDLVFIRAIVELAASLDLRTVAEAVETPEQARRLVSLGCQLAQGYHFARPAPAAVIEPLLAAQAPHTAALTS
jgi:diguanylate cyclase (GGDEF)-like protein